LQNNIDLVYLCKKTMIERILELLKNKSLTPSQFADEIGIQRSGMSHLLSGRNKPSLEFVLKVLKRFPDVSSSWLLQGQEETLSLPDVPITEKTSVQSEILFPEDQGSAHSEEINKISRPLKKSPGRDMKAIEKIVVFYTDRTFREYGPE
jgi:transcriptional regulator with XRE-family HTH domain